MTQLLKTWLAPIASCLMLQAVLISLGVLINHRLTPPAPCCTQRLVL